MAKYAELEANVRISMRGEIMGMPRREKPNEATDKNVQGDESRQTPDEEKKGVTA